jgi:hypothetical protein
MYLPRVPQNRAALVDFPFTSTSTGSRWLLLEPPRTRSSTAVHEAKCQEGNIADLLELEAEDMLTR